MEPEQLAENRRQLARLARQKKRRRVGRPHDWHPQTVLNPEDNQPFTEAGAWEFVALRLEADDQEVGLITLDHPPGVVAFVITCLLSGVKVYIKVHYDHGPTIVGRSFHPSDYQ